MRLVPGDVAADEWRGRHAVRQTESATATSVVETITFVWQIGFLDDDRREHDRSEATGPNQPRKPRVGHRAPVPSIEMATGSTRITVRLSTA